MNGPPPTGRNIAVVGAGYWGKNLVRNFDALGALAAICDHDSDTLATLHRRYPHCRTAEQQAYVVDQIRAFYTGAGEAA